MKKATKKMFCKKKWKELKKKILIRLVFIIRGVLLGKKLVSDQQGIIFLQRTHTYNLTQSDKP